MIAPKDPGPELPGRFAETFWACARLRQKRPEVSPW